MISKEYDTASSRMECRSNCAACCIVPSISSPIPGMQGGKPSGVRCVQLADDNRCKVFGMKTRPAVCLSLKPSIEMCGTTTMDAMEYLENLELLTRPETQ